jgi:hypothetical protein
MNRLFWAVGIHGWALWVREGTSLNFVHGVGYAEILSVLISPSSRYLKCLPTTLADYFALNIFNLQIEAFVSMEFCNGPGYIALCMMLSYVGETEGRWPNWSKRISRVWGIVCPVLNVILWRINFPAPHQVRESIPKSINQDVYSESLSVNNFLVSRINKLE